MEGPAAWHREVPHPTARRFGPASGRWTGPPSGRGGGAHEASPPAAGAGTVRSVPAPVRTIVAADQPQRQN
ncbi:hypothetical protein GCM10023339_44070 [Alloalcanivorax gelatiniphagus]